VGLLALTAMAFLADKDLTQRRKAYRRAVCEFDIEMAYGIRHPQRYLGFVVRGILHARIRLLWGARRVLPEAHEAFLRAVASITGRARTFDVRSSGFSAASKQRIGF